MNPSTRQANLPVPCAFTFEVVTLDAQGHVAQRQIRQVQQYQQVLGDGVVLDMVLIPGGTFLMGSSGHQGYEDERPQHHVAVAPFALGKYPVTQAQWEATMQRHPRYRFRGAHRPVTNVSWRDAVRFCERLSQRARRAYHLPSEAQWEYACRAGTTTPFALGETLTTDVANYCGAHRYGAGPLGIYRHETTVVGGFAPNAWGLYDMHGQVWEWCADPWHNDYQGAPADERVWEADAGAAHRIVRGGSWHDPPDLARCATRLKYSPLVGDEMVGFRVACY